MAQRMAVFCAIDSVNGEKVRWAGLTIRLPATHDTARLFVKRCDYAILPMKNAVTLQLRVEQRALAKIAWNTSQTTCSGDL